tara:strand:+ start:327 stop:527 length:201 start_codon:yes stop_codon:yes gene_type:complete
MDVELNISNIKKRLAELDAEGKRLLGMLEVFDSIQKLGVNKIESNTIEPEEGLNITTTEEVIDGDD